MEEDRIILEGICRREQDSFRKLFDKYGTYVVAVTVKVSGGALGSLKNLIGVMARNGALNALRSKNRSLTDRLDEESVSCPSAFGSSAEDRYIEKETAAALWEVINVLDKLDREIFLRRYFYLEKVADIARDKEMNEKTVSSRLARARQKLRDAIGKRGETENEA